VSEPTPLLAPLKPRQIDARLWRRGTFVADEWSMIAADEPPPPGRLPIFPLARWRQDGTARAASGALAGVWLPAGETIDAVADDLARIALVALPFPKFSDGRSYSAARQLREAGYAGEVRAFGDVLLDQIPLMLRAGFDSFLITDAATILALERGPTAAVPDGVGCLRATRNNRSAR
jgi:phosphoadenosine phosphosulfate reductase